MLSGMKREDDGIGVKRKAKYEARGI